MSRRSFSVLAVLAVLAGFGMVVALRQVRRPAEAIPTVTYHPTSPDLIAATGRPQLLEFFHKA